MARYSSTKTYGHDVGLSAVFRQWRADSHCRFLHGYALSVGFEFAADSLDANRWVVDFGSLKPIKAWLQDTFDHRTLVATDDPEFETFAALDRAGLIQMVPVPATGCEAFAELIFERTRAWLVEVGYAPRVRLARVEVREHGANSAIYRGPQPEPAAGG
jgi:6-pyruvoyltetrahydropterin/6-carboxytetrahydropterin synthase